jgi:hypothetical protein
LSDVAAEQRRLVYSPSVRQRRTEVISSVFTASPAAFMTLSLYLRLSLGIYAFT